MSYTITTQGKTTDILEINYNTNGLGEIVTIKNTKLIQEYKDRVKEDNASYAEHPYEHEVYPEGGESYIDYTQTVQETIDECVYEDVFFKPNPGVRIEGKKWIFGMSWASGEGDDSKDGYFYTSMDEATSVAKSQIDKYGNPSNVVPSGENEYEDEKKNYWTGFEITMSPNTINKETDKEDTSYEGYGLVYLGTSHTIKTHYTDKKIYNNEGENKDEYSDYGSHDYEYYGITGESNQFDIRVFGKETTTKFLYWLNGSDSSTGKGEYYIIRQSSDEQTYTNLVAFNETYDINGGLTDLPERYYILQPSGKSSNLSQGNWKYSETTLNAHYANKDSGLTYSLTDFAPNKTNTFTYHISNTSDAPIKSILMYVDCYLAVYSSAYEYEYKKLDKKEKLYHKFVTSNKDFSLEDEKTKEDVAKNGVGTNLGYTNCPMGLLTTCHMGNTKCGTGVEIINLFSSYKQYEDIVSEQEDNGESESIDDYLYNNFYSKELTDDDKIPSEHRWVQFLYISSTGEFINKYSNFVMYIDENISLELIGQFPYPHKDNLARYTNYMYVKTNDKAYVFSDTNESCFDNINSNCVVYPIVKPWAASYLLFMCEDGTGCFGNRDINWQSKLVTEKMKKLYGDKYCRSVVIKSYAPKGTGTEDSFDTIVKKMKEYIGTLSPNKILSSQTHGSRYMYDQLSDEEEKGKSAISCQNGTLLGESLQNKLKKILKINKTWNGYDLYFNMLSTNCFGSGMFSDQVRYSSDQNNVLSDSIVSEFVTKTGIDKYFISCGACSTHTAIGTTYKDGDGNKVDGLDMSDCATQAILNASTTYKQLVEGVNNYWTTREESVSKLILDFFRNRFDDMRFLLDDKGKAWMDYAKPFILDDLQTYNGRKYFTLDVQDEYLTKDDGQKVKNSDYTYEQEYFDKQGKTYRINDYFIAFIKKMMGFSGVDDYWAKDIIKNKLNKMYRAWVDDSNTWQLVDKDGTVLGYYDMANIEKVVQETNTNADQMNCESVFPHISVKEYFGDGSEETNNDIIGFCKDIEKDVSVVWTPESVSIRQYNNAQYLKYKKIQSDATKLNNKIFKQYVYLEEYCCTPRMETNGMDEVKFLDYKDETLKKWVTSDSELDDLQKLVIKSQDESSNE